jgi:hypothetical protein
MFTIKENIQELVDQYLLQKRRGEAASVEEYVQRHPDYENELRLALNDFEWIHAALSIIQQEEQEEEAEELTEEELEEAWQRFRIRAGLVPSWALIVYINRVFKELHVVIPIRMNIQGGYTTRRWVEQICKLPDVASLLLPGLQLRLAGGSLGIGVGIPQREGKEEDEDDKQIQDIIISTDLFSRVEVTIEGDETQQGRIIVRISTGPNWQGTPPLITVFSEEHTWTKTAEPLGQGRRFQVEFTDIPPGDYQLLVGIPREEKQQEIGLSGGDNP